MPFRLTHEIHRRDDDTAASSSSLWIKSPTTAAKVGLILSPIIFVLVTIFLLLRYWTQKRKHRLSAPDNILLITAIPFYYATVALNVVMIMTGCSLGEPASDASIYLYLRVIFAWNLICSVLSILIRCSIVIFWIRIFDHTTFRMVAWMVVGLSCLGPFLWIIATLVTCHPISLNWGNNDLCDYALQTRMYYAYIALNLAAEIAIFLLPFPMIWSMTITPRRRYGLMALYSAGVLCISMEVCGIVFNLIYNKAPEGPQIFGAVDFTLNYGLRMMVVCSVAFKPVVDKIIWILRTRWQGPGSQRDISDEEVLTIGRAPIREKDVHVSVTLDREICEA